MIFLYFLEFVFLALFLLGMVTQIFWPIVVGEKLFPLIRHRSFEKKLVDLSEQHRQMDLAEAVKRQGQELHKRRRKGEK